jgi:DNA ligase-1
MRIENTIMHGSDYDGRNPQGWVVTEKMDGYFARWTGGRLLSRDGVDYRAPYWFTANLPPFALDCELFAGYGNRDSISNIHTRGELAWRKLGLELVVFDAPTLEGGYITRIGFAGGLLAGNPFARAVGNSVCCGMTDLLTTLGGVIERGGEGLMIRDAKATYTTGRVKTMLKVKPSTTPQYFNFLLNHE